MTITATPVDHQKNRSRPLVAGLRVTPDEMEQLRRDARETGQSVSDYLRSVVLGARSA